MARERRPFDARAAAPVGLALSVGVLAAFDPVALLAWLALVAPALGFALGRAREPFWPQGPAVIGAWGALSTFVDLASERDVPAPLWGLAATGGLLGVGWAVGAWRARRADDADGLVRPLAGAGVFLFAGLLAAGAPVLGGFGPADASLARTHPRLARALLAGSPLTLTLECAGLDWTHSHPEIYRRSGVEWFPRHPYRGALAGPIALLLGAGTALVVARGPRFSGRA